MDGIPADPRTTPIGDTAPIVLASGSPRRSEILTMLGLEFEIVRPDIDERPRGDEVPSAYVERLAREKALHVAEMRADAVVIAGDTIVLLDGRMLHQPRDAKEAVSMIAALSGRTHDVLSGIAVKVPERPIASAWERTRVHFRDLDASEIEAYVETGEPMDKAGAYGIQGRGAALVEGVDGDYFNVVGLPVVAFTRLLASAGFAYRFGGPLIRTGEGPAMEPR
jgi:septum formation protein